MAVTNHFVAEGSPHEFASSRPAEGCRKPRSLTDGALIRTAFMCWLLAFLVGAGCLFAGEKGRVMGIVAGPSQAPIPGAKVTLAAAEGSRQSVTADQSGHYSFPSVEPGAYTLSAEAAGYQVATRSVQVTGGTSTTVDLLLVAAGRPAPDQTPPLPPQPSYYDDTQLKASAVKSTTDAAGYSSQAQSPQRLISEGPSLTDQAPRTHAGEAGGANAEEVERELQKALRADLNSFEANHQLGEYYFSVGDLKAGIPYLEKAQGLKPGDYTNGTDLAVAYLETKNPARAQRLLQELSGIQDTAELHNLLGEAGEALGDPVSAVNEFQLAAHLDPNEKNIFDWGNELLLHEASEPALEVFKRGVALYPNSQRMYIGLGIAFYSRNLYDEAIEALCHASELDPSDPRAYLFLGKMYDVSAGKADEVRKRMQRFTETNPNNALAYYYCALSSWKGSRGSNQAVDLVQVEALFRKSIALDPQLADAHLQLGILYYDQRREQEAIQEFQAAIRLNPDGPDAHYRLAEAYAGTGDKQGRQEELQLYEKLHKQEVDEAEKRRHEIQQFVFTRGGPGKTNP